MKELWAGVAALGGLALGWFAGTEPYMAWSFWWRVTVVIGGAGMVFTAMLALVEKPKRRSHR